MPMYPPSSVIKGQSQFVSVPKGWDTGYLSAQSALRTSGTPIRVLMLGQSIMAGFSATNTTTEGYRWLVRNFLVNKFGRSADYFSVTLSQHYADFAGVGTATTTMTNTPPWLLATSPTTSAPYGFMNGTIRYGYLSGSLTPVALAFSGMGGDATWLSPGAAATIATFQHASATWLETCQAYDLVVPNYAAGANVMAYNVNGAGANNVTLTNDKRLQVIQMATGLSAGRYNTVITGVASGQAWLSGVTAHATTRGAAGVQVAHTGCNAGIFSNMDSNYLDKTLLGRDASTGTVGAGGLPMNPHLVICNFLLTDTGSYSPDVSTQRFAQAIEAIRRASPNASIIFVADYNPNGVTTDGSAQNNYALGYPTHLEALKAVADQLGCAFVNVHDSWQGRGVALGYITSGEVHPTTAGHAAIANMITPLL